MKTKWAILRDLPATEVSHLAVAELWGQGRHAGRQAASGAVGSGPPHTAGAPVPVGLSPPTLTVTLTPHVPPCPVPHCFALPAGGHLRGICC